MDEERKAYAQAFGQRLERYLEVADMTFEELHKRVDVSVNNISRYRSGKTEPTLYVIYKMAKVLGRSADELLGLWEEEEEPSQYTTYFGPGVEVKVTKRGNPPKVIFLGNDRVVAVFGNGVALRKEEEITWIDAPTAARR